MRTPWGPSDSVRDIAPGILRVGTPGHGGLKLDKERNAQIPAYMRRSSGWYEEDCEWSIVGVVFQNLFSDAMPTFRNWYPDHYEKFTGKKLIEGESHKRDEKIFQERHKNSLVVISASRGGASWEPTVPQGFVLTHATVGGERGTGVKEVPARLFLVPEDEYQKRNSFGFIIDPAIHQEIPQQA